MTRDGNRILVAEDNSVMADVLEFNLVNAGFVVRVTCDGQSAWEAIQEEAFDLVITDYQMPKLNGEALIRNIRRHPDNAHVPVIVLSAKGLELDRARLELELGLAEVIFKPFSPRQVVNKVRRHVTRVDSIH